MIQIAIGLIVAAGFRLASQEWQSVSAIFGMLTSIVITLMLGFGVNRAKNKAQDDPKASMGILYLGAVQRFLLVLSFFIVGLAILKLDPMAMTLGFALTQFAYVFNIRKFNKRIH